VLHNVSLIFPAGQISAILGPSGSGKTTIVDLVIGLLKPREGEVWIDDLPFAQVNQKKWRRMIGYIPQDPILMHDTVINNITFGDAKTTEQDVKKALQAAGAWEFVKSMPDGMQTIVGERGGKLSGGQRQRISIARAIVHNPKLLILDEATSALDPQSEAAILETLQQLRGRLTILAISHQSALVGIADKVYRVKDGKIVATEDRSKDRLHSGNVNVESDPGLQPPTNTVKVLYSKDPSP
jgi:ATP-binding cassette subfamily C protein